MVMFELHTLTSYHENKNDRPSKPQISCYLRLMNITLNNFFTMLQYDYNGSSNKCHNSSNNNKNDGSTALPLGGIHTAAHNK